MGTIVDLKAFYNQPDYEQKTRAELRASYPPQTPVHIYESGNKWVRLSKDVVFHGSSLILVYTIATFCLKKISKNYLSPPVFPKIVVVVILPIGLYNIAYIIPGWLIHLHSNPFFFRIVGINDDDLNRIREDFFSDERVVKRVSVQANGYSIDTLIVGRKENLDSGRFIIFSHGNGEFYEGLGEDYLILADKLKATAIFYNYASTIRSSGLLPNRVAMLASHQAMLSFAEKLGAKEIVDFAHSIGGGVQGESLKHYPLKDDVKYVFVKHKTFANLSTFVNDIMPRPFGFQPFGPAIRFLNWNYSSVESSRDLRHPEIIIQKGRLRDRTKSYEIITDSDQVAGDGVITEQGALAKVLLDDPDCPKDKKTFVIVRIKIPEEIAKLINEQF